MPNRRDGVFVCKTANFHGTSSIFLALNVQEMPCCSCSESTISFSLVLACIQTSCKSAPCNRMFEVVMWKRRHILLCQPRGKKDFRDLISRVISMFRTFRVSGVASSNSNFENVVTGLHLNFSMLNYSTCFGIFFLAKTGKYISTMISDKVLVNQLLRNYLLN